MLNFELLKNKETLEAEIKQLKEQREDLKIQTDAHSLADEIVELKKKIALLKNDKKIEEEDIKHMVKMAEERNSIELEKKIMQNDKQMAEAIAEVKDTYRDKLEERLQKEVEGIKEMYGQILERLPNTNVRLKGEL